MASTLEAVDRAKAYTSPAPSDEDKQFFRDYWSAKHPYSDQYDDGRVIGYDYWSPATGRHAAQQNRNMPEWAKNQGKLGNAWEWGVDPQGRQTRVRTDYSIKFDDLDSKMAYENWRNTKLSEALAKAKEAEKETVTKPKEVTKEVDEYVYPVTTDPVVVDDYVSTIDPRDVVNDRGWAESDFDTPDPWMSRRLGIDLTPAEKMGSIPYVTSNQYKNRFDQFIFPSDEDKMSRAGNVSSFVRDYINKALL